MDSFGESLRRERELRHVELNEIAKITRIKKSYLQAIETDNFEELPDTAFIKGFIRAYCNYIGLDPDQTVNHFQQFYDENFKLSGQPAGKKASVEPQGSRLYITIAVTVAASAAIVLIVFYSGVHRTGGRPQTVGVRQSAFTGTSRARAVTQYAGIIAHTSASKVTPAGGLFTQPTKMHTLLLKATEDTWIRLEQGSAQSNAQEALLKAGQHVLWEFTGPATLTVGNAAGIVIMLDNRPVPHHHIQAEVIRLRL
ncbi:MAG: DUF4115 domain-containing protein [Deltaproteobacteria bacterium]|nr:DUF4115 domain-containing protein [Deltaproteobacteria bacterium]MCL5277065.1 DUF4115 domain-containing protein [Deltaproteobacteria bacterium]